VKLPFRHFCARKFTALCRIVFINKLDADAGPSPTTLACPAAPLAACVHRHPCTKTDKIWLPWQRPLGHLKSNFGWIFDSHSSTDPDNSAKIGLLCFAMISQTVKNKLGSKKQQQNA